MADEQQPHNPTEGTQKTSPNHENSFPATPKDHNEILPPSTTAASASSQPPSTAIKTAPDELPPKARFLANILRRIRSIGSSNVFWAILLAISASAWFYRHMERMTTIIGSGLVTIAGVVFSLIGWIRGDEMKALPRKLLEARWTRPVLIALFVISLFLNIFTSSFYVEFANTDPSQACTVQVTNTNDESPFVKPLKVTSSEKLAGNVSFFQLRSQKLRFDLIEPPGYEPKLETLGLMRAIVLRVPEDFSPRQFHIVRVVFDPRLWNNLPEPTDEPSVFYDMEISINGHALPVNDVRRQTIVCGAQSEDLERILRQESESERNEDLGEAFAATGFPNDKRNQLMASWERRPRLVGMPGYAIGEKIHLILRRRGEPSPIAAATSEITASTIRTILLKMQ